jgi:protein-S-isoprenylcysteine O-methyltransferase Ste14
MPSTPPVVVALIVAAGIWYFIETRQALLQRPEARSADRMSTRVVRASAVIAAAIAIAAQRTVPSARMPFGSLALWIGLAFLACGTGLRLWSFRSLGRYFTFTVQTSQDQPVISAGPYRVIRHPGYTGSLLAVMGVGFLLRNWLSLVILSGVIFCGLVYRIRVEERALSRDLGGRYQVYAEGRKRLVPFIW